MFPPFVMSKYASKADMDSDKAAYYEHMAKFLAANANNDKLTDAQFRQLVRDNLKEFTAPLTKT